MTRTERIQILKNQQIEDPLDSFTAYALTLELAAEFPEEATVYWKTQLRNFPQYLPTYLLAGQSFLDAGDSETAIAIWKEGLLLAEANPDQHASSELKAAIMNALVD